MRETQDHQANESVQYTVQQRGASVKEMPAPINGNSPQSARAVRLIIMIEGKVLYSSTTNGKNRLVCAGPATPLFQKPPSSL